MTARASVRKVDHPVRPWQWAHPACAATAGAFTHWGACDALARHLSVCPGHP